MSMRSLAPASLLGALGVFVVVSSAGANQPLIDRSFQDSGIAEIADCGSFKILDNFTIFSSVILWFDNDGNITRFIEQNYGTDQFSNSVTGKTLAPMHFHNTVLVDRIDHVASTNGIVFRYVVPGAGAVLLDVGRIVTSHGNIVFEAGPHQFFDGDLTGVCSVLL